MKRYAITVNGTTYDVQVEEVAASSAPVAKPAAPVAAAPAPAAPAPAGGTKVESPMPGNILDIKVTMGQQVDPGTVLVVLEAMKMENDIVAPVAGTVAGIHVDKGDTVDTGALLISIS